MYEFYYKYFGTEFNNGKLLFRDTDSLVFETETDDVYEDFYENKKLFDFSDYAKDSIFFHPVNKKVIGKIKDEAKRKLIGEFIKLNSNVYS